MTTSNGLPRNVSMSRPVRPGRFATRARAKRDRLLAERFPDLAHMRILDLGGTRGWWLESELRPAHVTIVNLRRIGPKGSPEVPWISGVRGDACELPAAVLGGGFDLVFSNSLIEHVGGDARRRQFADMVHRAATHHWVQTPNRYFPIEPHWRFPGLQFLPEAAQLTVAQRWPFGHFRATGGDREAARTVVRSVELLTAADMARYFPHSDLVRERFAGATKSIVAVR